MTEDNWLLVLVAAPLIVAFLMAVGRGLYKWHKWLLEQIAETIVDKLIDAMEPVWTSYLDEALEPVNDELREVRDEVTVNGGDSLKDRVLEMHRQLEAIITDR